MCRVIAVLNYKGGTGKTTTVVNMAVGLALRGARVLCIDLDAQGSLSTHFGLEHSYTLADVLVHHVDPLECIVAARPRLDVIASDRNLLYAEKYLWTLTDDDLMQVLRRRLTSLHNQYDYIFLDYSPSVSRLSEAGLHYADEVIVPVSMDYLALVGTRQVIEALKTINRADHSLDLSLIIPTFYYERLRKDREIMQTLKRYFNGKVAVPIRANVRLSEAPSHQKSIYEYAPRSPGAIDYARLVERFATHDRPQE